MLDRISLYPGRVTLTPVAGQANTYDMERADSPTQEGTALNKANLLKDATAALYGLTDTAVPDEVLAKLGDGVLAVKSPMYTKHTTLGELPVGNTITLNENGTPVEFYVAKHDYESGLNGTGRTLLVRKDCYNSQVYGTSDSVTFVTSSICTWLNGTYKGLLPSDIQTAMGTTKFITTNGFSTTQTTTAEKSVFLLSLTEYGLTANSVNTEGSVLPTASAIRIAQQNNTKVVHWTRSPHNNWLFSFYTVTKNGEASNDTYTSSYYVRPAFTLPASFGYVFYTDAEGNVYTEQEVEMQLTDVLGNLIQIPASQIKDNVRIETGSYTGTGTYGASNPNSLTFEFAPTIVFLYGASSTGYYVGVPYNSWWQLSGASYNYLLDMRVIATEYTRTNGFGYYGNSNQYGKRSQDGKTISWYVTDSASYQLNESGVTYYYLALG